MALAAVISLMNTIENLTDHSNPQIISVACHELKLLKDALGRSYGCGNRSSGRTEINPLDDRIREAIRNLEDVVHQQVTEEMGSCLEAIKNLREEYIRDSTTKELVEELNKESKMIRLSDLCEKIVKNILSGWHQKTVSLSGMAGIGKTFLARAIYQHPKVVEKFDLRVWVTSGPKPCIENIKKERRYGSCCCDFSDEYNRNLTDPSNPQIISAACNELKLLKDALTRSYGCGIRSSGPMEINPLDDRIRAAIRNLEDVVHQQLTEEMGSCLETIKNLREEFIRDSTTKELVELHNKESKMIRLSDQCEEIVKKILRGRYRKTVSLSGMAGIGKTFLAREIYQHPKLVEKFDLRVWVTLGPKPCIENILIDIATQIGFQVENPYMKDGGVTLTDYINQNLRDRTHFIVLDDIWSTDDWIRSDIFPDFLLTNRIQEEHELERLFLLTTRLDEELEPECLFLLTTRLDEVAEGVSLRDSKLPRYGFLHKVPFLNQEESWNLLCEKVFVEEKCPPELEEAGMMIAEQCQGLPLLILEVARLLSQGQKDPNYSTPEVPLLIVDVARVLSGEETNPGYRNEVGRKQKALFQDARRNIADTLYSSYEHLNRYLQECFLYMAAFPENYEIPVTKLIHLWIAEDFVKPSESKTLEDSAMECLKELDSQSLVITSKSGSNNVIKFAKLHSTYWQLCVDEARKTKFLHVLGCYSDAFDESTNSQSRLSVQNNVLFGIKEVYDSMAAIQTTHSLLCTGKDEEYPVPICSDLMSLKVLDALAVRFYEFPNEVLKLLDLKYLALTHNGDIPSSISKLQNLQSLILRQHHNIKLSGMQPRRESTCLPKEIWDMQELRHLRITGSNLPDPSNDAQLPNLFTLHVKAESCTEKVFKSIPKLKKLGINIVVQPRSAAILNCFEHIFVLQELESLKCVVMNPRLKSQVVAPPVSFPSSLKKLSLSGLGYSWDHMSVIGSLPNLQVLKLRCSAFQGPEWETKDEEFTSLKYLLLEDIDLEHWTAEDGNFFFAYLEILTIRRCFRLKEIPELVGQALSLERIDVFDCNPSIVDSAVTFGNFYLKVRASSFWNM